MSDFGLILCDGGYSGPSGGGGSFSGGGLGGYSSSGGAPICCIGIIILIAAGLILNFVFHVELWVTALAVIILLILGIIAVNVLR